MAITRVTGQHASAAGNTVTLTSAPTVGNLVVVGTTTTNHVSAPTCQDSAGKTYTLTPSSPFGGGFATAIFYLVVPSGATGSITVAWTGGGPASATWAQEYAGAATTSPCENDATNQSSGVTVNLPSYTPTNNNDLLFCAINTTGQVATINSPWAIVDALQNNNACEDQIQTTATAQTPNATQTGSATWIVVLAAFTAAPTSTNWQGTFVGAGAGAEAPTGNLAESGFVNAPGAGAMLGPTTFDTSFTNAANAQLSGNFLTVTSLGAAANTSARSDAVAAAGQVYCEFTATSIANTNSGVGICNASQGSNTSLQASLNAVSYAANGNVYINSVIVSTLVSYTTGDIIDVALDIGNSVIYFRKNGGTWNNSGTANPTTNTGGISISSLNAGPYYAAVEVRGTDSITANFGATPFQ